MKKYNLEFISDEDFYNHVNETVKKYRFSIDLSEFNLNIIDPIKLTFDSKIYKLGVEEVIEREIGRQIDKSNTNHIGYFHQNIFNYIGKKDGWSVPERGYDVVNSEKKVFVEMKNKHNTMNSSSSQKTYMRMLNTLTQDTHSTCMLVEVIAKRTQNVPWVISLDGERVKNEKIRRVSIDKFYEIVTGDKFAFRKICEALPFVLSDVMSEVKSNSNSNTVLSELSAHSPVLLKSLYLLAFREYEGFQDLNIQ